MCRAGQTTPGVWIIDNSNLFVELSTTQSRRRSARFSTRRSTPPSTTRSATPSTTPRKVAPTTIFKPAGVSAMTSSAVYTQIRL